MPTLKEFSDALSKYDQNVGWGRYAANWGTYMASFAVSVTVPGTRSASMQELFNYLDELKSLQQPEVELPSYQITAIHRIIKKHLPIECGGSLVMEPDDFFKLDAYKRLSASHRTLIDLCKFFSFPEYWKIAASSIKIHKKAEQQESRIIDADNMLYDADLKRGFETLLSTYLIRNNRVLTGPGYYRNPQNCLFGHCYDVDYEHYHANKIGTSNIVLAHAPVSANGGKDSMTSFIEQIIYSKDAPVTRILAIGTPKSDRVQTDVGFINYLREGDVPGSTAENKMATIVVEHPAFKQQYGAVSPNLQEYNLTCNWNGNEKTVEVLLLREKTIAGDPLNVQMMAVIEEFITTSSGNVAIHCYDGVSRASFILLVLELLREPHKYFNPQVDFPKIEEWIENMRQQSTRAFVPAKALLYEAIDHALTVLEAKALNVSTPRLGNGQGYQVVIRK